MKLKVRDFYNLNKGNIDIESFSPIKFNNRFALYIKLTWAIDISYNNKINIINEVIVVNRYCFSKRLKRLKKFPISVNVYDKSGALLFYAELIE